jgi:hypothetical protein
LKTSDSIASIYQEGETMDLNQTLQDNHQFLIFSLALMTLSKSAQLLLENGADPAAISAINRGISLISKQLDEAAKLMETELEAGRNLKALCEKLGIASAHEVNKENSPPEE